MARATRSIAELGFDAIQIEGALIAPEMVAQVARTERNAKAAEDYACPKGTNLGDEIARYFRIGQAHWQDYAKIADPTTTQVAAFARALLGKAFGFDDLTGPADRHDGPRRFRLALEAKAGRVPIVCAAPVSEGDAFNKARPEFGDGEGGRTRRSPTVLLQDWLNATDNALWGLVFAGDRVRLMRDNASLTRPAWIEADLGAIFREEMFADFTALWLLIHATRFGAAGTPPSSAPLERWREAGQKQGIAVRDRLREGVEAALQELGQGIVSANPEIGARIEANTLSLDTLFEELLRTVYRLIFLAVAEDRDLLHPPATPRRARDLYAGSYGFGFWRERSARRTAYDAHHDAWEGIKITFAALETGQPALGLPALGGLFESGRTPVTMAARIPNRHFLMAVHRLGWLTSNSVRARINWRDMKTEELGSVYESLLEIRPVLRPNGDFELDSGAKGNARKTSGSYYTPDSLVETLLDSALDPVLQRAEAEGGADAILKLKIIDPAIGSGHFMLGAARRMADRVARLRDPDAPDTQAALRDVVGNCIHGVDRNPMAVELAKVALWIESMSPGKPLGFLDANIRCGDALLGVFDLNALVEGIPDDAYKPLTGDDKATASGLKKLNRAERDAGLLKMAIAPDRLASAFERLHAMPEGSVNEVRAKDRAYRQLANSPDLHALKLAADAYVAAFLLPKPALASPQSKPLVPTTRSVREALAAGNSLGTGAAQGPLAAAIDIAVTTARAFHWPVEFPDVIIGRGGFDVVLGNPPWEVVQLGEEEYFESRVPEIAALKGATRKRAIAALEAERPEIFADFQRDKRTFDAMNEFARASGRFDLTARGKVNTYGLFAEHFLNLTREGGRAGVIVPTGIATDATTAAFFGHLVSEKRLVQLVDFENRERLFVSVDSRTKFCLLTLGNDASVARFAFFATDPAQLEDKRRHFTLSPEQIMAINPNTKTASIFRADADASLTAKIYGRVPVLYREDSKMATIESKLIQNFFSGSNRQDQLLFESAMTLESTQRAPVFRGSMVWQFDCRASTFSAASQGFDEPTHEQKSDPGFSVESDKHVALVSLRQRFGNLGWAKGWMAGWRDITNGTNERTVVSAVAPASASDDTFSLILPINGAQDAALIVASLNSLVLDFVAQQKVGGTHIRKFVIQQFPILPPSAYTEADLAFIVPRVLELSYTSHAMAPFARDLGFDGAPFAWDEDRRAQLRAELDGWYALAYGLTRDELRYVLDPKEVMGAGYPSETFRVLQKNEIARHGEYRTARLVLAAYDALIAAPPETVSVPDRAWEHKLSGEVDVRLQFAALLKRMRGAKPVRDVVHAMLFAARPHLLMTHLNAQRQAEWRRLVGNEATPPSTANVVGIAAGHLGKFNESRLRLAAERALLFDAEAGTWDRGAAIYDYTLPSWAEGRADFVWHAMQSINLTASATSLPQEERNWIGLAAAA